jgi:hypothetical protein
MVGLVTVIHVLPAETLQEKRCKKDVDACEGEVPAAQTAGRLCAGMTLWKSPRPKRGQAVTGLPTCAGDGQASSTNPPSVCP